MPVSDVKDLAIIGQAETTIAILRDAALIAPITEVRDAEVKIGTMSVETEEDSQRMTALAGKMSGWSSKIEAYFKGMGVPHYQRYKLFGRLAAEGVNTEDVEIPGSDRLNQAKRAAESKVNAFVKGKREETARRQTAINRAVATDVKTLDQKIDAAADLGDMATVRELKREREMVSQTPVVVAAPVDIGNAAVVESVTWSLAPNTGLMDLVKAVAAGTVPLYREVTVKGTKEMRPIFLVNEVVLNQATRAMGKNLNWPGVVLEDDISLRTRKL